MNIQSEKIEIAKLILETNNPAILRSIKNIFKKEGKTDFWETLSSSQREEIENGISELENGEVLDYEDFMKNHRK
ncbi:MAG: hypothetical protein WD577_01900 [Bacteroidales bacterium]